MKLGFLSLIYIPYYIIAYVICVILPSAIVGGIVFGVLYAGLNFFDVTFSDIKTEQICAYPALLACWFCWYVIHEGESSEEVTRKTLRETTPVTRKVVCK